MTKTRSSEVAASGGTCTVCRMKGKYTHSAREHAVAEDWIAPLLDYVKTDAFMPSDSPLTYGDALVRFNLDTTVRRVGRVLDAVELILVASGWPAPSAAGITAYVVNAGTGKPGEGWIELWNMNPQDARAEARAHVRALTLGIDGPAPEDG